MHGKNWSKNCPNSLRHCPCPQGVDPTLLWRWSADGTRVRCYRRHCRLPAACCRSQEDVVECKFLQAHHSRKCSATREHQPHSQPISNGCSTIRSYPHDTTTLPNPITISWFRKTSKKQEAVRAHTTQIGQRNVSRRWIEHHHSHCTSTKKFVPISAVVPWLLSPLKRQSRKSWTQYWGNTVEIYPHSRVNTADFAPILQNTTIMSLFNRQAPQAEITRRPSAHRKPQCLPYPGW